MKTINTPRILILFFSKLMQARKEAMARLIRCKSEAAEDGRLVPGSRVAAGISAIMAVRIARAEMRIGRE